MTSAKPIRPRLRERSLRVPGLRTVFSAFLLLALFAPVGHAQDEFYHPELEWKTIETPHFLVNYHEGAERTARVVAKVAEDIYEPVTSLYQHTPDTKVSFNINDVDDISNGAAYFYDNKIELYAPSMDFDFRGTHNWLRNVVTHEFTHIVQIQTAMKFGRRMPALYFQWLGYQSERRPDVLYGYPDIIVSYPLSGFVVPAWFAEGVAQFNRKELRYDFWDTHRDMILRMYALNGSMLTWQEMGVFGKNSLGNESSYNAGFAFVSYIARTYGDEKLAEISRALSTLTRVTIDGAIEDALGKSGEDVYNEWRREVERDYAERIAPVKADLREGEPLIFVEDKSRDRSIQLHGNEVILQHPGSVNPSPDAFLPAVEGTETGFANMFPHFSPDGKKLAYVSTKGGDYFSQSSLYMIEFGSPNREKRIQPGVRTAMSWSPDGTKLYYARGTRDHPHWSYQFDLYCYDLTRNEETRLTHGRRAITPAVSPDGSTIVCVVNSDGTSNLALMNIDGSNFRLLTSYTQGEQVYNPHWSPSGDRILFDYSVRDGRDIGWVKPDGTDLQFLVTGPDDARTAAFVPDGSAFVFSSDRTGIFNLYRYDLRTGAVRQVSNVLGGAFMPAVSPSGSIIYAGYTATGYKLFEMDSVTAVGGGHDLLPARASEPLLASAGPGAPQFDWLKLKTYDDTQLPDVQTRPYKMNSTSLSIVPLIRIDNYNPKNKAFEVVKPGVYLFSNDMLDKTGLFAGAAMNVKLERDLFFQFFYRSRVPLLYQLGLEPVVSLEAYNVTRKTGTTLSFPNGTVIGPDTVNVTFNLLEFDVAFTQPFLNPTSTAELRYIHSRYTSVIESFINPEDLSLVPGTSDLYLVGNDLALTFRFDGIIPSRTSDINPVGRRITLRLGQEWNKYAKSDSSGYRAYDTTGGSLHYAYNWFVFPRVELTWKEYIPFLFNQHTLIATVHGGAIVSSPVDEFFDFYAGGLIGMRGYPFYSIGGNRTASVGLAYRFPLLGAMDLRFLQFYFDKLYMSVFADIGDAWTGAAPRFSEFKTDAGFELRLESFSWYAYPTRIFFSGAYGFSPIAYRLPYSNEAVHYGREWQFYFGVLFGFDFD